MKLIREKSCCFTGHRAIPSQEIPWIRQRLREEIPLLFSQGGIDTFLAGGALGFDTLAAQEVLRVRAESLQGIHLVLVLPCLGQEANWSQRNAAVYQSLLRQADEVIYTSDLYSKGCMFLRNRYLVDHSACCVCYYTGGERGGTAYTVRYAKKRGISVVNLADEQTMLIPPSPNLFEDDG